MPEPWQMALLFATGLVAGFVDAIAGGGGLITLPVMLSLGGDPQSALGTNKLQATFGSGSATWHYARAGAVDLRDCGRGAGADLRRRAGGHAGRAANRSPHAQSRHPAPADCGGRLYVAPPAVGARRTAAPRMSRARFDLTFGLLLGFYDGFFGPGTGTFWAMAFVLALGFNLTRATGYTKAMNFSSNLCSFLLFALAGKVNYGAGIIMGVGQLIGARFGSRMVMARGTNSSAPCLSPSCSTITGKLLYDACFR